MLIRSGIILIKYWFSITDDEQNLRFMMRIHDPLKQWKLSPMDMESRRPAIFDAEADRRFRVGSCYSLKVGAVIQVNFLAYGR